MIFVISDFIVNHGKWFFLTIVTIAILGYLTYKESDTHNKTFKTIFLIALLITIISNGYNLRESYKKVESKNTSNHSEGYHNGIK